MDARESRVVPVARRRATALAVTVLLALTLPVVIPPESEASGTRDGRHHAFRGHDRRASQGAGNHPAPGDHVRQPHAHRHTVRPAGIRVHDGDTFYAGMETIRLRGIDTPELGQPRSRQATRRLIELLREGPVTIVPRAEDVYGRTIADVYVGARNVADVLKREGFAKHRPGAPTL